jgi:prepilin-type N-terminal cleavage/methylation domain-containing protein
MTEVQFWGLIGSVADRFRVNPGEKMKIARIFTLIKLLGKKRAVRSAVSRCFTLIELLGKRRPVRFAVSRCFTLIELLVVIAILAILATPRIGRSIHP